jgi:polygalacturonase
MQLRLLFVLLVWASWLAAQPVFNIKEYGATGHKENDARPAIQQAIDACGMAKGGTVYFPPGEYTSGQLHLRSGVRIYLEAGATLFASLESRQFDPAPKPALIYGEDLHDIALEGRGTIDGQSSYEWKPNNFTDFYILSNQRRMEATGKPLMRPFPTGFGNETIYPRLVLLLRCVDVRITGLKFLRSRSWTINPYACKRLVIDGVYIYSSQKEGVWADGIDPDGCQDVRISNSTIETGDDAIVFYSTDNWGPVLPTENVTVTNCRLSSSSSAIKFCDGNSRAVRRVVISNVVITNSNRGLAFMVFDGGVVEDVVISNLTIETRRFDWFWWGDGDPIHFNIKRRSEVDGTKRTNEPPAGIIRNVTIQNVIAHGAGTSAINGHPDSWLEGVRLDNVRLFLSRDADGPYENTTAVMVIKQARDFAMKDVEIHWQPPYSSAWETGLVVQQVKGMSLDGVRIDTAPSSAHPVVILKDADGFTLRHSQAETLRVSGGNTKSVHLIQTDSKVTTDPDVPKNQVVRQ